EALEDELHDWEADFTPPKLYERSAVVVRAEVEKVELLQRADAGIVLERRVSVTLRRRGLLEGDCPDPLSLQFVSVPRAPRFRPGEEVVVFLSRGPDGLYFEFGKRAVFHVVRGDIVETSQPVAEFVKSLRPAR